jgi:hypothetical protein
MCNTVNTKVELDKILNQFHAPSIITVCLHKIRPNIPIIFWSYKLTPSKRFRLQNSVCILGIWNFAQG